ncbi:MAG: Holliday junction branch migration protein RuvA [Clostridia bacterium]|nr:Holliday junction branch migration protein RuvA [Clostridia bacterium]MBQ5769821.1 Holliday junction branch migration protein RuvA [Clostridia bacterium]
MYAHIRGILSEKLSDSVVIDASGVGYELSVSANTLASCPQTGEEVKLYAYLSVREDAMELFGFWTREEKKMFLRLIGVSGIGPKTALGVLSALSVRDLSIALVTGDAQALSRAPGIGKKTAQRLVLELKDKVENEELTSGGTSAPLKNVVGSGESEAIEALMALGYPASEAAKAVSAVSGQATRTDEILRLALKNMSGRG